MARTVLAGICAILVLFVPLRVEAQNGAKPNAESATPTAQAPQIPNGAVLRVLIVSTVLAVDQANKTGNYSVLRDLAAPGFQLANSQAKLAEIFATLRGRNLDLSPVILLDPKLFKPAEIMPNGMLRLFGFFDSRPEQVLFDMLFQPVNAQWRLFGVSIDVRPPVSPAAGAKPAPPSADATTAKSANPAAEGAAPAKAPKQAPAAKATKGTAKPAEKPKN